MSKTVLVTGGAGFIGSNYCRYLLKHRPETQIVILDALTYAGNLSTLADLPKDKVRFYAGKFRTRPLSTGFCRRKRWTISSISPQNRTTTAVF